MENFLNDNFGPLTSKQASEEARERWRYAATLVKNPKRRFRFTANLSKRYEAEALRRRNQGKLRTAILVSQAALAFGQGVRKRHIRGKYKLPKEVSQAGFEIDADRLSTMVTSRSYDQLKNNLGVEGIARCLNVSLDKGISTTERPPLPVRQKMFGSNIYEGKTHKSFWTFTWDAMHDITHIILLVCAVISIIIGTAIDGWPGGIYDGFGIILCVLLVVNILATSHYKQYKMFQDWGKQRRKTFVRVLRDGDIKRCSFGELVVGDIVLLGIGYIVPADGIFVSGHNLLVDQSSLTGESEPVNVNEKNPFLFFGTKVQDGSGKMLVVSVGMRTYWGSLMATMRQSGPNETPLHAKLNGIARIMRKTALAFSLLTFFVLTARLMLGKALHKEFLEWSAADVLKLLNYAAIALTVLVVGVPEGVPLALTLVLAIAARKLMNEGALLKNLSSCETMASVTCICTDKTGTLTTNHMVVDRLFICNEVISSKDAADFAKSNKYEGVLDILLHCIILNSECDVVQGKDGTETFSGSPTESALLEFSFLLGGHYHGLWNQFDILDERPFDSFSKRSSVLVARPGGGGRAFCIGAAEIILHECTKIVCCNGEYAHFSEEQKNNVLDVINGFCLGGLRTLCLAFKDVDGYNDCRALDIHNDYTLISVVGISDPVRPEVKSAVQKCLAAGITVRMVTGDNINTAKAIAKECGILANDGLAIEAKYLLDAHLSEFEKLMPKIQVVARSSPDDKHTMVTHLKSKFGEVVAVTGDGTNDASALHAADLGLAMGIAGTEVARMSADIVLMDDNFTTLVNLVKWGHLVYRNIQQFMQFQLTVNIVAVVFNFVSACISGCAPLAAVQVLWVNMISVILGVLALVKKLPNDQLEKRAVARTSMEIFTNAVWWNIACQSTYQLTILFVLKFYGKRLLKLSGEDDGCVLDTAIFNTFVSFQVFNEINITEVENINIFGGMLNSWLFATAIAFILIFQIVNVELLGPFAHTTFGWHLWLFSILIGFGSRLVAVLMKCIPRSNLFATLNCWKVYIPLSYAGGKKLL